MGGWGGSNARTGGRLGFIASTGVASRSPSRPRGSARGGEPGRGNHKHGADGKDVFVEVPLGTVVRDSETREILFEINEEM